jgi:hypothetical protein
MANDPIRRSAARIATLVAVPVAVAVALISLLWYGGFGRSEPAPPAPAATGPVTMDAPSLAADTAPVCQQVVAHLPDTIGTHARRPVTAGPEQNAAYGDPPITLACGTPMPSVQPTDDVFTLSGVCWHAVPGNNTVAWTTVDRVVPVTVTVPGSSDGSAQSVVPFSPAVSGSNPRRNSVPSGCQ